MTPEQDYINKLKDGYKVAVESKKETFMFDGQEMSTDYVKYLLEYLKEGEK
jgi:hypothetical protein